MNEQPRISVFCRTTFEGFHRWKDAPKQVEFLRDWHRHIFHVELHKRVTELNREIEFIMLRWAVDEYIRRKYKGIRFEASCEMIAQDLFDYFGASKVIVSEDGENGAVVTESILDERVTLSKQAIERN